MSAKKKQKKTIAVHKVAGKEEKNVNNKQLVYCYL